MNGPPVLQHAAGEARDEIAVRRLMEQASLDTYPKIGKIRFLCSSTVLDSSEAYY